MVHCTYSRSIESRFHLITLSTSILSIPDPFSLGLSMKAFQGIHNRINVKGGETKSGEIQMTGP